MLMALLFDRRRRAFRVAGLVSMGLAGCSSAGPRSDGNVGTDTGIEIVNPGVFDPGGLATPVTEESCTLSSGATTTCLKVALKGTPSDHTVGPFCPRTIDDTKENAGIWLKDGTVYDVDGGFVKGLAQLYNDPAWKLYDELTGKVRVTDTRESCQAAARPDVDPAFHNYCVECAIDYVQGGVATTLMIPKYPQALAAPIEIGRISAVGVALNGVAFDPPAPLQAILGAHTIAAFDDCGGHVNLVAGYHYHAATGCSRSVATSDGHAALIGYALDGYAIHAMLNGDGTEPSDLDTCRGHRDNIRGYHYHAASAGENMFIGCFHGAIVAQVDAGGPTQGGGGEPAPCAAGQTTRCCGDGVCDGPETKDSCAADCP